MSVITIVGSGMMGSAMSFPACANGHTVRLTGTHLDHEIIEISKKTGRHPKFKRDFPQGMTYHQIEELDNVIPGTDLLICGVSSFGVDWFAEKVLPKIPETMPILAITKGLIADKTGQMISYPEYWSRRIAPEKRRLNAVGGPCNSFELVAHDQTVVTFCGKDENVLKQIRKLLHTSFYHIELSTDIMGTETAVALKNAYAVGVALAVGLSEAKNGIGTKPHTNSQAALFGQSVKEMRRLLQFFAGSDNALDLAAGDLYVTICAGRTRLIGTLLGRGLTIEKAMAELEGLTLESVVIIGRAVDAVRRGVASGKLKAAYFPLLLHLGNLLDGKTTVDIPWDDFTCDKLICGKDPFPAEICPAD